MTPLENMIIEVDFEKYLEIFKNLKVHMEQSEVKKACAKYLKDRRSGLRQFSLKDLSNHISFILEKQDRTGPHYLTAVKLEIPKGKKAIKIEDEAIFAACSAYLKQKYPKKLKEFTRQELSDHAVAVCDLNENGKQEFKRLEIYIKQS